MFRQKAIAPSFRGATWDQRSVQRIMSSDASSGDQTPDQAPEGSETPRPDWADGLRQLYDAVVDEPLPDTFKDLLDRLDEDGSDDSGCEADGSDRGQS